MSHTPSDSTKRKKLPNADAGEIMQRKQVPVLCFHLIRNWRHSDSRKAKECIIPLNCFKKHIKTLADSGYHTILPEQLYDYLVNGGSLPAKPIILSFDDTNLDQYTKGAGELKKYGFKAVYFITAEVIGKGRHMKASQIKDLADSGNAIANHTWNHPNLLKIRDSDWTIQLDRSNKKIEKIISHPVVCFAYPFGLYNDKCINELHQYGFKMAFQLGDRRDQNDPLMTLRRILDDGHWTTDDLINTLKRDF
jgi:peptidoglycan/xylan/chitin deacetylase (PgdA/CDA1 family)